MVGSVVLTGDVVFLKRFKDVILRYLQRPLESHQSRIHPEGLTEDNPWLEKMPSLRGAVGDEATHGECYASLCVDCFAPLAMTAPLTSLRDAVDVEATPKAHRCVGCVYVEITHTKPNCTTNGLSQSHKLLNRVFAT